LTVWRTHWRTHCGDSAWKGGVRMIRPFNHSASRLIGVRRVLDVVLAIVGVALTAWLMPLIAVAICIDTPGPVFFAQLRLGQGGRKFRLYKFRKFADGPGSAGGGLTLKDDPRLTRVGRLLERTKLDELPQLWNVLIGDMAVVGPRPETLHFADCFTGPFLKVLDYKPGLFGPNQILFRHESALLPTDSDADEFYRAVLFPAKARVDLWYFPHRTLASDFGWMISVLWLPLGSPAVGTKGLAGVSDVLTWLRQAREQRDTAAVGAEPELHG
jgi:lipopolysaccharide/colanic/teichoic acid biosynthesis glycosyltransferase